MLKKVVPSRTKLPLGVKIGVDVDLHRFIPYRVHKLWAHVSSPRCVKLSSGTSIRAREWRVLLILAKFGPKTNSEIAQLVHMDSGTTTRAVKDLLQLDLVTVRSLKSDRRKQVVTLTQAGAAAHDEIAPQRLRFGEELLEGLGRSEQDMLILLLDKLDARLEAMRVQGDDPFAADE